MQSTMGERSSWRGVALLLGAALVLALLTSDRDGRSNLDPRPTSFRATPRGTLALFLMLQELGIPAERRLSPLVEGDPLPEAMVILRPTDELTPLEARALLAWVEDGGRLIYAPSPGDPLLAALGLSLGRASPDTLPLSTLRTASVTVAAPQTAGIDSVRGFRFAFPDSAKAFREGAQALLRIDAERVAVVRMTRRDGEIFAWSDTEPLSNRALRESGAALLFARLARELTAGGQELQFDEYHHGFRGGGSPAGALISFLARQPAGWMTVQLLLVGGLLLLLLGARFGSAEAPAPPRRRSPLEHLHALARAYEAGGARGRARHLLLAGAARRLGAAHPGPLDVERVLRSLPSEAPSELSSGLVSSRKGTHSAQKEENLTTLAARLDELIAEKRRT